MKTITTIENSGLRSLTYDNPAAAVFLRTLAWEIVVAKRRPTVGDVVETEVQTARMDLGLKPTKLGAPHAFLEKLRRGPKPALSPGRTPPRPTDREWEKEWRLLYLPSHRQVRSLSVDPVVVQERKVGEHTEFEIVLRNASLPRLSVTVGSAKPKEVEFVERRGVYFLKGPSSLYIGRTREFHTRFRGHRDHSKKKIDWWILVSLEDVEHTLAQDSLAAAESFLISFWNEVCVISNRRRGEDQKPAFMYLQQGVLLAEAASAAFLWLMREGKSVGLPNWKPPFKPSGMHGWPECYMKPLNIF